MLILDLPFPPSVNHYYRSPTRGALAGRHLISQAGRTYRAQVKADVQRVTLTPVTGRLAVHVDAFPPDNRRRDLDNIGKALLDALVHAGVITDDGDIDQYSVTRKSKAPNGRVRVFVSQATGAPQA